jgi:hypothetical protein
MIYYILYIMPCSCSSRTHNIKETITKVPKRTEITLFTIKTKQEKMNILRDYIKNKPINIRDNYDFKVAMVELAKTF